MGLFRLLVWRGRLLSASWRSESRRHLAQRAFFLVLGTIWLAMIGFSFHSGLTLALRRSPEADWLPGLLLQTAWLSSLAVTIYFNVGFLLHVLFFAPDLAFLVAAPLRPTRILAVRFVEAMGTNAFLVLFLALPATLVVGLHLHGGVLYYLISGSAFVCFLAFPVALTFLVGIPLARWVSTSTLRAVFSILGFLLAIGLWTLPYLAPGRISSHREWTEVLVQAQRLRILLDSLPARLLPSSWTASALVAAAEGRTGAAVTDLLVLAAAAVALGWISVTLGARSYLAGWIRLVPVGGGRPVRSPRFPFLERWVPRRWRPLFWKDFALVSRDFRVSFQLYSLGILMCLFPFLTLVGQGVPIPPESAPLIAVVSALVATVVVASQAGMMIVPLEGRAGFRLLCAPLAPLDLAAAKWLVAVLLALPIAAGQVVIARLGFHRPLTEALGGGVLALAGSLMGAGFGVFMGATFGNFQWDHPRRMIRHGAQLGWALGVGAIVVGLTLVVQLGLLARDVLPGLFSPFVPLLALGGSALVSAVGIGLAARRLAAIEWLD